MWRATNNIYPPAWEREIRAIKEVNDGAFKHMIALPTRKAFITHIVVLISIFQVFN